MYRRNMSGKLKKVVLFLKISTLLLLSRPYIHNIIIIIGVPLSHNTDSPSENTITPIGSFPGVQVLTYCRFYMLINIPKIFNKKASKACSISVSHMYKFKLSVYISKLNLFALILTYPVFSLYPHISYCSH